jgi:hypothetical protein
MNTNEVLVFLTPGVVALVVAAVKWVSTRVPKWALVLMAAVLGIGLEFINSLITSVQNNVWLGLLLGLGAIGLREFVKQFKALASSSSGGVGIGTTAS